MNREIAAKTAQQALKTAGRGTQTAAHDNQMDVGKTMLSRDARIKGVVTGISTRYCAACGYPHLCYLVTWENGRKTKPCTKGVKDTPGGALQIA